VRQLHSDVWVAESPLRFFGLEIGARMTVIRLPDRNLLLHSPIAPTPELVREVEALGPVAFLIAPNRFHHLSIGKWLETHPEALVYVAPGLEEKRSDLKIARVLTGEPEAGWVETLDQVLVEGLPLVNEVVFHHRASKILIATDLAFNVGSSSPLPTGPMAAFLRRCSSA
jgi:hypothetical protein